MGMISLHISVSLGTPNREEEGGENIRCSSSYLVSDHKIIAWVKGNAHVMIGQCGTFLNRMQKSHMSLC